MRTWGANAVSRTRCTKAELERPTTSRQSRRFACSRGHSKPPQPAAPVPRTHLFPARGEEATPTRRFWNKPGHVGVYVIVSSCRALRTLKFLQRPLAHIVTATHLRGQQEAGFDMVYDVPIWVDAPIWILLASVCWGGWRLLYFSLKRWRSFRYCWPTAMLVWAVAMIAWSSASEMLWLIFMTINAPALAGAAIVFWCFSFRELHAWPRALIASLAIWLTWFGILRFLEWHDPPAEAVLLRIGTRNFD